jgi:eukaryotic-like serine/threonine-protein kinase
MMDEERHPVDLLAEEFSERLRHGERPSIEEYTQRYPEHADLIRAVFPSVAAVERVAQKESDSAPSLPQSYSTAHRSFGDFEVVRRIGSGGMGVVYEAIQRSLQRRVALKVMSDSTSLKAKHRLRFRREAEAAAGLHHTNIVPIFGIGEEHGLQYYAMQLIDGATLQEIIECLRIRYICEQIDAPKKSSVASEAAMRLLQNDESDPSLHLPSDRTGSFSSHVAEGTLRQDSTATQSPDEEVDFSKENMDEDGPWEPSKLIDESALPDFTPPRVYYQNVARIIASAANALAYAHHAGVLHRDIKPANLLLDREGTIWVTDFGLARRQDVEGQTQTGELLGTLRYMAPEQIRGDGDYRMDIYSLGLTLFELLTLKYGLESPKSRLIDPMGHSRVRFSKAMQHRIPRDLQTIVLKACALAPSDRYQRAGDLEEDVRRYLEDRPILARRASAIEQLGRWARRNPTVATLATLSFGLLLTLAGLLAVWNRQQQDTLSQLKTEYERAESNLLQKTQALQRAETEQTRAEKNMEMALEAFDQIMTNIAARGGLTRNLEMLEEESPEFADASLTQADVELLQSLSTFFDRFAKENATDLRLETAVARRRVGEIQHRIGKLDDATKSLNQSIEEFETLRKANPTQPQPLLEEIAARQELITLLGKRGQMPRANMLFTDTRRLIESQPSFLESTEGQFAVAQLLGSMVNVGARFSPERRRRPPFAWLNRTSPAPPLSPAQQARWRRETELNAESASILERLVDQSPSNHVFQVALARAYKDRVRILIAQGEPRTAEESLLNAAKIMESLLQKVPESAAYRYELADILCINVTSRSVDSERCHRSLELCDQLLKEHPGTPEYLALKATVLVRLALMGNPSENRGDGPIRRMNEAIEIQTRLAERYPEVALYGIALMQYHFQQSEMYFALKRPEKARESLANAAAVAEKMQKIGVAQPLIKTIMERIRERRANLEERTNG